MQGEIFQYNLAQVVSLKFLTGQGYLKLYIYFIILEALKKINATNGGKILKKGGISTKDKKVHNSKCGGVWILRLVLNVNVDFECFS